MPGHRPKYHVSQVAIAKQIASEAEAASMRKERLSGLVPKYNGKSVRKLGLVSKAGDASAEAAGGRSKGKAKPKSERAEAGLDAVGDVKGTETSDEAKERKKHRYKPGTRALMEIRHFQRTVDPCIPFAPFCRVVREVDQHLCSQHPEWTECIETDPNDEYKVVSVGHRFAQGALEELREAAEAYLLTHFQAWNASAIANGRPTIMVKDAEAAKHIRTIFSLDSAADRAASGKNAEVANEAYQALLAKREQNTRDAAKLKLERQAAREEKKRAKAAETEAKAAETVDTDA